MHTTLSCLLMSFHYICVTASPFKAIRIDQRHKELKIFFFTIVRSRGQQEEMTCNARQQTAQLITFCVLDFAAPHGC